MNIEDAKITVLITFPGRKVKKLEFTGNDIAYQLKEKPKRIKHQEYREEMMTRQLKTFSDDYLVPAITKTILGSIS